MTLKHKCVICLLVSRQCQPLPEDPLFPGDVKYACTDKEECMKRYYELHGIDPSRG
jgi:hypothetical protein